MRGDRNKRLTILSETEKLALYGLPDFDDLQRLEFFAMTQAERTLAFQRQGTTNQVYCLLQLGYFKAKHAFFQFSLKEVSQEDIDFLLLHYFPGQTFVMKSVSISEYYTQRNEISSLFDYSLWSDSDQAILLEKAMLLAKMDVTTTFLLTELIVYLNSQRIVRPGYSTLQSIIGDALIAERQRLEKQVDAFLDDAACGALQNLILREDTLSGLASIKQDAKHFGYRMMVQERQKYATLAPLYAVAKSLLPNLGISQLNIAYYASLANYYTIYDLRRFNHGQTHLYLLCYIWHRYRKISDNLIAAFGYHKKKLEKNIKEDTNKQALQIQTERQQRAAQVGQLLLLYVDETIKDTSLFGSVRQKAFSILPKEQLLTTGKCLSEKPVSQLKLHWLAVDKQKGHCTKNLRPLVMALDFGSSTVNSPWLGALHWMKSVFARQQRLAEQPLNRIPEKIGRAHV